VVSVLLYVAVFGICSVVHAVFGVKVKRPFHKDVHKMTCSAWTKQHCFMRGKGAVKLL
jgi:hypothetical protein